MEGLFQRVALHVGGNHLAGQRDSALHCLLRLGVEVLIQVFDIHLGLSDVEVYCEL